MFQINFLSFVSVDNVTMDLRTLMQSKDKAVNGLTTGVEFLFKKNNVRAVIVLSYENIHCFSILSGQVCKRFR